jgi:GDP-L-fucose synthase
MRSNDTVFVAGGGTLLGMALVRVLSQRGFSRVLSDQPDARSVPKLDLTDARAVDGFFEQNRIAYVFDAAGKSGGIGKNRKMPATLMLDNLLVTSHLVSSAFRHRVKKLLFLGSSCSYPRHAPQPMAEPSLLTGPLEPTNEPYAVAKIAGMKLCEAFRTEHGAQFISAIPANAFGIGDDYSPEEAHVVGALLARAHAAKIRGDRELSIWGTGKAIREFIFADDVADASIFLMNHYDDSLPINIGSGNHISIAELAREIARVVGFEGKLTFDTSQPDGMPVKSLDATRIAALGWKAKTSFSEALDRTYRAYLDSEVIEFKGPF